MIDIMKRILLGLLLFFAGCGTSTSTKLGPYSIGRDPSWYPLHLKQMTVNINGFTNALVQDLAKIEHKNFRLIDISWIQLFDGLEEKNYAGIFSSLEPTVITEDRYSFSDPFLLLGPVLVVPITSKAKSLADLNDKVVGAYQFDESVLILQRYPSVLIETYQSPPEALVAVVDGEMEGVLIPNLEARALVAHLYPDQLKIVTPPLSNKGLRLLTLKGQHQALIKAFNNGLETLRKNGTYQELRDKFGVK